MAAELGRGATDEGALARAGFLDPDRAAQLLTSVGLVPDGPVADALADAADPDVALASLVRIVEAASGPDLRQHLRADGGFRRRLTGVLGVSSALGEHLVRHPGDWQVLVDDAVLASRPTVLGLQAQLLAAVGAAGPDEPARDASPATYDALRVAYRRALLTLAARDIAAGLAVEDVAGELADLAAAVLRAALAVAHAELPHDAVPCRLAVIGMGKCGGRELNYVSDVDVLFVAEPADGVDEDAALRTATLLARGMMRACSRITAEGAIWPVDAALRPEGKAGPLVRTLASHEAYYKRWAKTWEFQALLKARPVAGDLALGREFADIVRPLVWTAGERPHFVEDVQAMRRRVVEHVSRAEADREIKLGPGGLRDVEFAVQLLQLVHGRGDESLRSGTTLVALAALADGGYVGRDDARALAAAYRFLRTTEHRLQLQRLRRTHTVPTGGRDLRWLARSLGYRRDPVAEFEQDRATHAREVRRLHEKLFYRPLLSAVARLPTEETRLTTDAARHRLEALGFADPAAALRHIEALATGVSRRAAIQRTLLPAMLGWFADAPDPDAGLLSFRQVSESLGSTPWYLRLLRDEGATAERLARLLATSRFVADLLGRAPSAVALLADEEELTPRPREALEAELLSAVRRNDNWESAVAAARGLRRQELVRIGSADVLGRLDVEQVGAALTDVVAATLSAALDTALREVAGDRRRALGVRLAVIGLGRLGGGEQGYGSDADVLFVYDGPDDPAATQAAHDVAEEMRRLLAVPAPDPPLVVDAGLRPEGKQGPLVRSLASYAEYYRRWSSVWESQALLRACFVAGDAELGARFAALVDPLRYPAEGLDAAAEREIKRLKARMESERIPRGADAALHLKLGRGGLSDVEWTSQLLQLRHSHDVPALRTTSTLRALEVARETGLLDGADAQVLEDAWRTASRIRNAVMLVRGRPSDTVPSDSRVLSGVARLVGRPGESGGELVEDYRRVTRHARTVVERLFYG